MGGLGLQGRAATLDLARSPDVEEVICADADSGGFERLSNLVPPGRVRMVRCDASRKDAVRSLLAEVDVAVELLPVDLMRGVFEAAVEVGVPMVGTSYGRGIRDLQEDAESASVALAPECGLDPGIDLVLCAQAVDEFDRLEVLNSYCGGFPERAACDNPLSYKISWNWDAVLRSQTRDAVLIADGSIIEVPARAQHDASRLRYLSFPGLGELEAIPNGDAVSYAELLGVRGTLRETGRYSLRWPGWCALMRPLKELGLLSDEPVPGIGVSPREFLNRHLAPRLQYRDDEKDLVVMRNVFQGIAQGRRKTLVTDLRIERDLASGLFAMSLGVGYTASIVAQMIGRGEITAKGVLSPAVHVPPAAFRNELHRRGIEVHEKVTWAD